MRDSITNITIDEEKNQLNLSVTLRDYQAVMSKFSLK